MNKKVLIIIISIIIVVGAIIGIAFLSGGNKNSENTSNSVSDSSANSKSLKEDTEEAKKQIEIAMKNLLKETYGEEITDSKIYVKKIYSAEDEKNDEILKTFNLEENEVAFEVQYELLPAKGVDVIKFTAATGEYDEESGWIKEKYNVGILRPDGTGYKITEFGTAF